MSKEIIEPLEKARAVARVAEPNKAGYKCIEQHIDQALTRLKQQPSQQECDAAMVEGFEHTISKEDEEWMNAPMGTPKQQPTAWEFTKEIREKLTINPCETTECKLNSTDKECIECLEDAVFDMGNDLRKACDIIDSAESINADLLTICEQVQDWLDTSSLQKVLVHCTDAKEKDALIMGVASHLERLEAAIEKAKV